MRTATISEATHRPEDLIPKLEDVLSAVGIDPHANKDRPTAEIDKLLAEEEELTDNENELVSLYLSEYLFDALDEIAPKGTYFGAHPGDGACFGFWTIEDEDQEDEEADDLAPPIGHHATRACENSGQ